MPGAEGLEGFGIREIVVQPLAYSATPNAFFEAIAKDAPRGTYPRAFSGEQAYWTVAGADGDTENALVGEDGAVEPAKGSFSVEPFLFLDGELLAWGDVAIEQLLEQADLPIPTATWRKGAFHLAITAFAAGPPGASSLRVRYRAANSGAKRRKAKLYLAVRPFQVNPPTQFLNGAGGVTQIVESRMGRLRRRRGRDCAAFRAGASFRLRRGPLRRGPDHRFPRARRAAARTRARATRSAMRSGALAFDLDLLRGGTDVVSVELPLHPKTPEIPLARRSRVGRRGGSSRSASPSARGRGARSSAASGSPVRRPRSALLRTLRSNLAYALLERDGPALRPGTRSYARSWIRDGALISAALLRLGHADEARAYIEWFARDQDPDGRVPCCVDRRGADRWPRTTATASFSTRSPKYWRFTRDAEFLRGVFPHVESAAGYIDRAPAETADGRVPRRPRSSPSSASFPSRSATRAIRQSRCTPTGTTSGRSRAWKTRRRWRAAAGREDLARALGRHPRRVRARSASRRSRGRSRRAGSTTSPARRSSPTSTRPRRRSRSIPRACSERLPRRSCTDTFERYYEEFVRRRDRKTPWDAYTPVRDPQRRRVRAPGVAGSRARAARLLPGRPPARPRGTQWAEVVGSRAAHAALRRRHAARLGRRGLHPLLPRPLRVGARERRSARPRRGNPGELAPRRTGRRRAAPPDSPRPARLHAAKRETRPALHDRRPFGPARRNRPAPSARETAPPRHGERKDRPLLRRRARHSPGSSDCRLPPVGAALAPPASSGERPRAGGASPSPTARSLRPGLRGSPRGCG